jgi:uncharacterized RDD family membrane protein YckC
MPARVASDELHGKEHRSGTDDLLGHAPRGGVGGLRSIYDPAVDEESEPEGRTRGVLRRRIAAACLDLLVVTALTLPIGLVAGEAPAELSGASFTIWLGVVFLYYAIPEWRFGASLGKHVADLRVVRLDAEPIRLWQSLARTVFRVIDLLPVLYLVGAGSIALTERRQRVGDLVARTQVVSREP